MHRRIQTDLRNSGNSVVPLDPQSNRSNSFASLSSNTSFHSPQQARSFSGLATPLRTTSTINASLLSPSPHTNTTWENSELVLVSQSSIGTDVGKESFTVPTSPVQHGSSDTIVSAGSSIDKEEFTVPSTPAEQLLWEGSEGNTTSAASSFDSSCDKEEFTVPASSGDIEPHHLINLSLDSCSSNSCIGYSCEQSTSSIADAHKIGDLPQFESLSLNESGSFVEDSAESSFGAFYHYGPLLLSIDDVLPIPARGAAFAAARLLRLQQQQQQQSSRRTVLLGRRVTSEDPHCEEPIMAVIGVFHELFPSNTFFLTSTTSFV